MAGRLLSAMSADVPTGDPSGHTSFASIVAAVAAGRKIYLDIQRAFLYLIAFHIPIVGLALLPPSAACPCC
jgi:hypothetical protein